MQSTATVIVTRARLLVLALDDLLAAVVAGRADVMPQVHFARRRLDGERRLGQRIVGAVHAALRRGLAVLWDCHDRLLVEIIGRAARPAHPCSISSSASCRAA